MKGKIKLAIVGSRTFDDYDLLVDEIKSTYADFDIEAIVSGGAKGADSLGAKFAEENSIPLIEFKPDWKKHGRRAGFLRNFDIIDECTHCIAFWDGESHGTKHDIDLCETNDKPCKVVLFS